MILQRVFSLILLISFAIPVGASSRYGYVAQASIAPTELESYFSYVPQGVADSMRPQMSDAAKYFTVLSLFRENDPIKRSANPFLAFRTWQDFQIFPNLLHSIDRTSTLFGKAVLAGMLIEDRPVTDVQALQRKQQVIKQLVDRPELLESVEETLAQIKDIEQFLLLSFANYSTSRQLALEEYYSARAPHDWPRFQFMNKVLDEIEKSPAWNLNYNISTKFALLLSIVGVYASGEGLWNWMSRDRFGFRGEHMQGLRQGAGQAQAGFSNFQLLAGISGFTWALWQGLRLLASTQGNIQKIVQVPLEGVVTIPNKIRNTFTTHRILQEDFAHLGAVLSQVRPMAHALRSAGIVSLVPECNDFFVMCEHPEALSKDMASLLEMLKTGTFKGKFSIFSHYGRLFAANHLMKMSKKAWARVLKAIGHLDAYVSLAKLVRESQNGRVKYCFPEYLERNKPYIEVKEFWHPMVGAGRAVPNDLTFGEPTQNIILTGPFAAGKSTIMRGLGIAALMAQNLGIAPATSMRLTPFAMINTSMNISDNLANDLSGFASELKTAGMFVQVITQNPQFSLNIFDELFRATSDADAEKTLYKFAKKVAVPNALNIFATHKHTDKIIGLEQEYAGQKLFANFKVESPDGVKPDFKLKKGWTRQSLLHDSILGQVGLL